MTDCRQTTTTFVAFIFQLKSLLERDLADNDYHKTFSELPSRHKIVICERVRITIVGNRVIFIFTTLITTFCFGVYEKFDSRFVKNYFLSRTNS